MLIVCSERVDEKNFQEILCNVKTPIILQILSSQSMLRWMPSLIHIWCHFVVLTVKEIRSSSLCKLELMIVYI